MAVSGQPDMIVLNVEMPGMDGIQTCQETAPHGSGLFLSVRSEETDVVLGLGVGADNYLRSHSSSTHRARRRHAPGCATPRPFARIRR